MKPHPPNPNPKSSSRWQSPRTLTLVLGAGAAVVSGCEEPAVPTALDLAPSFAHTEAPGAAWGWESVGPLGTARRDHAAALLHDGTVLIVGGTGAGPAELFDPATGTFSDLGPTAVDRTQLVTATTLQDGTVLIVGAPGAPEFGEIYDPVVQTFTLTDGRTSAVREAHSATLLTDGRVLLAGGQNAGPETHSQAELYDPTTRQFAPTGDLVVDRGGHGATLLADGRVLVAGGTQTTSPGIGNALASAETYDPGTGLFTAVGSMSIPRGGLGLLGMPRLAGGEVLVAGGFAQTVVELFDPATGTFRASGSLTSPHSAGTSRLLTDGSVLIAGGNTGVGPVVTATAEVYDPASGSFSVAASMGVPRQEHTATVLLDGSVLVTGGYGGLAVGELASAERFAPQVTEVDIAIKPGGDPNTVICTVGNNLIPVAVLTTDAFDATTVDHETLGFEGAGEFHLGPDDSAPLRHERDVDDDGDLDLVAHFRLGDTGLDCESTSGTLLGATFDNRAIRGTDRLRMITGSVRGS
ncbi:MAG: hypothetical protein OEN56_07460 [Gemmatimonadota bacterium]|nr:hypothetical protein [Gemmatimonadota bacterium]